MSYLSEAEAAGLTFGTLGWDLIEDTDVAHAVKYVAIKAINSDVVVTVVADNSDTLTSETLLQGDFIVGPITSVTRKGGGKIIAYKH